MYQYTVKVEGRVFSEICVQSESDLSDEEIHSLAIEDFKDEYSGYCFDEVEAGEIEITSEPLRGTTPRAVDAKQPPDFCGRCGSTACTCKYGPYPVLRQ
jgi:hypothetical protein